MEPQKQANDEIDLGQLFRKLGDAFRGAWLQLMRFLAAVRSAPFENRVSFIGIISVSVLLSIGYSVLLKRNYYESTMILSSQYLNKRLVDNALKKLDQLA